MKLAGKARWPPGEWWGLPLRDGSSRTPEAGGTTRSLRRRHGAPASLPRRAAVGGQGPVWSRPLLGSPRRQGGARPRLGTETQLQVDTWVQREEQDWPARVGGWERAPLPCPRLHESNNTELLIKRMPIKSGLSGFLIKETQSGT